MRKIFAKVFILSSIIVCTAFIVSVGTIASAQPWGLQAGKSKISRGKRPFGQLVAGTYFLKEGKSHWRIITLTADGNWFGIASHQNSHDDKPSDMGFTNQQGTWKRTGTREITAKVLNFNFDAYDGALSGNAVAIYELTFSPNFHELSGNYDGKVFPPEQNPLDPNSEPDTYFDSSVDGTRVTVDD